MRSIVNTLLFFILLVVGFSFACLNATLVSVDYYVGQQQWPLSLLLVYALGIGAILGLLVGLTMVLRYRREAVTLRRRVKLAEEEVENLRHLPIQDKH